LKIDKKFGLTYIVIGFLMIMLIKAHGADGSEVTLLETIVPSVIQTEEENGKLSSDNKKLKQELANCAQGEITLDMSEDRLNDAEMKAALIGVTGPGLRITLDDSKRAVGKREDPNLLVIHDRYIREIFNALWNGGAEAIALNGQRVTSNTEVFCSGSYIQINGTHQMPPYVIEAIGDENDLTGALKFYDWFKLGDLQQENGIIRELKVLDKVEIPAGIPRDYKYAKPVKEEK